MPRAGDVLLMRVLASKWARGGLDDGEVGGVWQFGDGLPWRPGDRELSSGPVDGGELASRREHPREERGQGSESFRSGAG